MKFAIREIAEPSDFPTTHRNHKKSYQNLKTRISSTLYLQSNYNAKIDIVGESRNRAVSMQRKEIEIERARWRRNQSDIKAPYPD